MTRSPAGGRVFASFADEAWQVSLFRLVLIALLAGSLAVGPAVLRWGLGGPWSPYLIPIAMLFATVAVISTTLLGRPGWRDRRGSAFRFGEMLLLVIAARVLVWIFADGLPGLADLPRWFLQPDSFFTGNFIFATFVWLFVWSYATTVTADFLELAIQPDEVAARESHEWGDSQSRWRAARPTTRTELLQRFATRWIGLGILLVACAAITRFNVSVGENGLFHVALGGLGMRGEVVVCLVCYFLSGLLLMSQGRLAVLRGRWYNQDVELAPSLIRRWHTTSLLFIGLIALVALLLPLGQTSWLTPVLEFVFGLLARVMMGVGFVLGLIIAFLAGLLSRLFGVPPQQPADQSAAPRPVLPTPPEATVHLPPWVGNAFLWLVVVLVAAFLLLNFLRTTGVLESKLGKQLTRLRLWWRARRARINVIVAARVTRMRRRLRRAGGRGPRPQPGPAGPAGPLLPRDQVRRYYLRAVQEAGEEGVARPPHKTPLEYEEDLRTAFPETEGDVRELTEAFIGARYSAREMGDPEVKGAESAWRRLVRRLRQGRPLDSGREKGAK